MKIVLINPPQIYTKTWIASGIVPPMGLLYLAASLKQCGHEPIIIDSVVEAPNNTYSMGDNIGGRGLNFTDIIARIPDNVALIGITNLFSFAFPLVRELTKEIKKFIRRFP